MQIRLTQSRGLIIENVISCISKFVNLIMTDNYYIIMIITLKDIYNEQLN